MAVMYQYLVHFSRPWILAPLLMSDVRRNPVRNIADPERPVVHLAVLSPALLGREDPQRLLRRGERAEELVRRLDRDDAVVLPVRDQHRAGDSLRDPVEREQPRAPECRLRVVQAENPLELEIRLRALLRVGLELLLDFRLPGVQVT